MWKSDVTMMYDCETPKGCNVINHVPINIGINPWNIKNTVPVLAGFLRVGPELVEGKDAKIMTKQTKLIKTKLI